MSVMNKVLLVFFLSASFLAFSKNSAKPQKYLVPKMVCENCAHTITEALKKSKRIKKVNFDIPKKSFTIEVSDGQAVLSKEEIGLVKDLYHIIPSKKK